jgi:CRISPR-associated endonuclease/helicase Cas3
LKSTLKKSNRMNEVRDLLLVKPRTIAEICVRLRLEHTPANHKAIERDFRDLRIQGYEIDFQYTRPPTYTLVSQPPPRMKPDEALAAHIALRLLYHHTSNPPHSYKNALEKIAQTMPKELQNTAVHSLAQNKPTDERLSQFEKIARCWAERRAIAFNYLALNTTSNEHRRVEIEPYFVEISRSNFEIYVIGRRINHPPFEIRTFLLSLMQGITPLNTSYEIPADFDPQQFLSNAWGVIGDRNPIIVRLKFNATVRRWLEKRRLPGVIHSCDDEQNNLILTIQTGANNKGEPQELIPFIRGWGANVEVLEPLSLRQQWIKDARAVVERFGCET